MTETQYSPDDIHHTTLGRKESPYILWAHGWGQSHASFLALAQSFEPTASNTSIDFPGFGSSPPPPDVWSTADYADALAAFIKTKTDQPIIWIGHSFGCRVGIQIAARHPGLIKGLCLIAGAGLPRKRSPIKKLDTAIRIYTYKCLKKLIPTGLISEDCLKSKFGSADYRNADPLMRNILVKTVNEDLSNIAPTLTCPVQLIYGSQDTETPPEIGERLERLIPTADLKTLEGLDHYSILAQGRHQVTPIIKRFIETLK